MRVDRGAGSGRQMHDLVARLLPLPRSLTGSGVRATLEALAERLPLRIEEIPSGTEVLDWTVPAEWRVHGARVLRPDGSVLVDWADDALHLLGYSVPFRGRLSLPELLPHLHTLPEQPSLTPYRTAYFSSTWGFCLPHERVVGLPEGDYDVVVDTELFDGSMTLGELVLPGEQEGEVLLSAHVCHPAQANDNLSAVVVAAALAERLAARSRRRWTYRFLFAPGTIGAITWLHHHRADVSRLRAGLVLTGLGDRSPFSYKCSRQGDTLIDRVVAQVLAGRDPRSRLLPFSPYGYDERQFCSPGFDLPVGRLSRGVHGEYPEYHTSADDLSFVDPDRLADALDVLTEVLDVLERDRTFRSTAPFGEPQLGRRGLYRAIGGDAVDAAGSAMAQLWVLNLADGRHSLMDMAARSGLPFDQLAGAAERLEAAELLVAD
jgi:aminopeptidase-like protein